MAVLVLIPNIAPVSPFSTIFPLVFVLFVSELRELLEEWQAGKRDKATNKSLVDLLIGKRVECASLRPGDIVLLRRDQRVPADVLVLQSAESDGSVLIETASLDGETNLKIKKCPQMVSGMDLCQLISSPLTLTCEPPHVDMYAFSGQIRASGEVQSTDTVETCSLSNIIWRGCTVRNTEWVAALVVYAGPDCKVNLNARSGLKPSKVTAIDRKMNGAVVTIVAIQIIICSVCAAVGSSWFPRPLPWYLIGSIDWVPLFFAFFVLLGSLIPVSLWVSVELLRGAQAVMIEHDTHSGIRCNSKNLHEELGQITHVFTDKTGTLTVNKMKFVGASVGETLYLLPDSDDVHTGIEPVLRFPGVLTPNPELVRNIRDLVQDPHSAEHAMFLALALCHTCDRVVEPITGRLSNQAASPDEASLVSAAAEVGCVFSGRPKPNVVSVIVNGAPTDYVIVHTVGFTSERRMMTVVARETVTGETMIYSKGADSSVLSKCATGPIDATKAAVSTFSHSGFRTLCVAARSVSHPGWSEMQTRLASGDPGEIAAVNSEIESNLTLLGSTAVEDRLQTGVPETLQSLKSAGIKICMITGDKRETAVNIARACGLISSRKSVFLMLGGDQLEGGADGLPPSAGAAVPVIGAGSFVPLTCLEEIAKNQWQLDPRLRRYWLKEVAELGLRPAASHMGSFTSPRAGRSDTFSLVIDGKNLQSVFASPAATQQLVDVLTFEQCEAVVFCRVSPKQKGEIVRLVQRHLMASNRGGIRSTLAIGDGANDINMINIANVGVGIAGNEGAQAANSADYAIKEFADLYRLLLVHGRFNYRRTSGFIAMFLYKNFAFTICQFWFATVSAFSAQTASESAYLLLFNSVFGIIPLFLFGTMDKDVDADTPPPGVPVPYWKEHIVPRLYRSATRFTGRRIALWCLLGLVHSVVVFFGVWLSWEYSMTSVGRLGPTATMWMGSILVYTAEICLVSAMTLYISSSWTKLLIAAIAICNLAAYFAFVLVYDKLHLKGTQGYVWTMALSTIGNVQFWFILAFIITLAISPLVAYNQIAKVWPGRARPGLIDSIQTAIQSGGGGAKSQQAFA